MLIHIKLTNTKTKFSIPYVNNCQSIVVQRQSNTSYFMMVYATPQHVIIKR